jgi:hypothetical protein
VEISSNSNNNNRVPEGAFRLTAQCLGTPEEVQRPLTTSRISAVQLNVGDGSTGTRLAVLLDSLAFAMCSVYSLGDTTNTVAKLCRVCTLPQTLL